MDSNIYAAHLSSNELAQRATTGHRKSQSTIETTQMLTALSKFSSVPYVYISYSIAVHDAAPSLKPAQYIEAPFIIPFRLCSNVAYTAAAMETTHLDPLVARVMRRSSRSGSTDQLPLALGCESEYESLTATKRPSASELRAAGDILSPGVLTKLAETPGNRRSSLQAPRSHRMSC